MLLLFCFVVYVAVVCVFFLGGWVKGEACVNPPLLEPLCENKAVDFLVTTIYKADIHDIINSSLRGKGSNSPIKNITRKKQIYFDFEIRKKFQG